MALGGTGNDRIHSSNADLTSILIDGGLGNDSLLRGGGGADTIFGGDGVDRLEGQDGNDLLEGGAGADSLLGGDGDDTLIGGGGADRMHGENGDDFIIGGNGDVIFANAGDDFIELDGSVDPDLGRAFIDGNDGIDTVSLVGETNTASVQRIERVIGSAGVDELVLSDSDNVVAFDITEISGVETIHAQKGDDVLTITTNDTEAVFGGLGTDRVTLTDGAGNSLLLDGVEGVTGAEGLDEVMLSDTNAATLGIFGVEVALGGTGNDRIHSSNADLTSIFIDGGLGNDSLLRGGGGADTIFGGDGIDRLEGQDGNDLLEGGAGADSLLGGNGADTLIGGAGGKSGSTRGCRCHPQTRCRRGGALSLRIPFSQSNPVAG